MNSYIDIYICIQNIYNKYIFISFNIIYNKNNILYNIIYIFIYIYKK